MTVQDILDRVRAEQNTPGRFPSRLIFVRNYSDYALLVDELRKECDITLDLASFARGDIFPNFRLLKEELGGYSDKLILLLSMGEYLRICLKKELNRETSVFPGLWTTMQPENSTTKYMIPLFGGRELFDQIVPFVDERQQDFLWEITESSVSSEYTIKVFSPEFSDAIETDASSFQEWLCGWDDFFGDGDRKEFSLKSKLVKYTDPMGGNFSVKVIDEPFRYVVSLVSDGESLKPEWGEGDSWTEIVPYIRRGEPFSATIKSALNIGENFDPIAVLALFPHVSDAKRRLLWIWYQLYPDKGYCSFAIRQAKNLNEIPTRLRDAIFEVPQVTEQKLKERREALKVLGVSSNAHYLSKLDLVFPVEERFSYLTYQTLEERAYAIKTVSELLRIGAAPCTIAETLRIYYPDLAEYLLPLDDKNDEISRYFNWYRKNKILNRPPECWPNYIDLDSLDSRHKILQQSGDALTFWIDGLGAEWLPLLVWKLGTLDAVTGIETKIGRAIPPTETEHNRKWKDTDEKWDRLDQISHEGIPDDNDYFLCIARQIEIMGEIAERVSEMLSQHERIIITGDHGSSRMAALMFHVSDNFAIDPPANSIVRSFGRFCELTGPIPRPMTDSIEQVRVGNKDYLVMTTYEHFRQPGNAAGGNTDERAVAGEVHGGMTPEEYLVPIIVVTGRVMSMKSDHIEIQKAMPATLNDMGI